MGDEIGTSQCVKGTVVFQLIRENPRFSMHKKALRAGSHVSGAG
jgi:hypothetical protein